MMMIMKRILLLLTIAVSMSFSAYAQKTGSFDETINFNGEQRTLSYYVPLDYSPDSTYKLMVGLHGAGDNSINYRNGVNNQLQWQSFLPTTIFVYPDGGNDQSRDFYAPEGDELIISEAINAAKTLYPNIDQDEIILQGFSLGGRSALIYGLDNHEMFKGLVLNTPAIQGIYDLENKLGLPYSIKYENAKKIPIAIVHGEADFAYLEINQKLERILIENDGIVFRVQVSNMPHTIPPSQIESSFFNFVNRPYRDGVDIHFVDLELPQRTCQEFLEPQLLLRNFGGIASGAIIINFKVNGKEYNEIIDISLEPFQALKMTISQDFQLSKGENEIQFSLESVANGDDINPNNNTLEANINYYSEAVTEPITMGFEGNEKYYNDWYYESDGNLLTWEIDDNVAKTGSKSLFTFNTLFLFTSEGLSEDLLSPFFDLSKLENKNVSFDIAYSYHQFGPPLITQDILVTDTLKVFISSDCGDSFELLYEKSGVDLLTKKTPITNPNGIEASYFAPTQDEWRTDIIDLSDYGNNDNVTLKFSLVSGQGGCINLDNILIGDAHTSVKSEIASTFSLSPNPATTEINIIENNTSKISNYTITNLNGEKVGTYSNAKNINISGISSGVYFITKDGTNEFLKFIKE